VPRARGSLAASEYAGEPHCGTELMLARFVAAGVSAFDVVAASVGNLLAVLS
jgi:hypothetical protein